MRRNSRFSRKRGCKGFQEEMALESLLEGRMGWGQRVQRRRARLNGMNAGGGQAGHVCGILVALAGWQMGMCKGKVEG